LCGRCLRRLSVASAVVSFVLSAAGMAAEPMRGRDVAVTLKPDGEHCVVHKVTIVCADLASHLRGSLKLPDDTMIRLRAGRTTSFESVRRVLDIIEKSGFRYPGARSKDSK
jgi:hypothetical protein